MSKPFPGLLTTTSPAPAPDTYTELLETSSFVDHAHFGVYRFALDGQPLIANLALAQLYGYDSVADFLAAVKPATPTTQWNVDPERRQVFLDTLLQQGFVKQFESELYRHNTGERVWVSEDGWLVCDEAGQPLYYEGIIEDISERKEREHFQSSLAKMIDETLHLGQGEAFYHALLCRAVQTIPGAQAGSILLFDDGRYRYVAAVGYDLHELSRVTFTPQEMPRKHSSKTPFVMHPETVQPLFDDQTLAGLESSGRLRDIRAALSIPIVLGEHPLAVINLDNFSRSDAFGNKALELADLLAKQLVIVLGRLQLEKVVAQRQETLERSATFHRSLLEFISNSLKAGQSENFYSNLLQEAVRVVPGAQAGSILLKKDNRFHFIASEGFAVTDLQHVTFSEQELKGDSSEPYRLILRETPIVTDTARRNVLDTAGRVTDIKVSLSIPILHGSNVVAFLFLDSFETQDAFSDHAVSMSRIFAEQIGVLLGRFALEQSLSNRQKELATWSEFHRGLMDLTNDSLEQGLSEQFYQRLLEHAASVIPGTEAGSVLTRGDDGRYTYLAAIGHSLEDLREVTFEVHEVFAAQTRQPRIVSNISEQNQLLLDPKRNAALARASQGRNVQTLLTIPVVLDGENVACFSLDAYKENAFSDEALELATALGTQVALLLQRLNLEQKLRARQAALERWETFRGRLINLMNDMLERNKELRGETFYHMLLEQAAEAIPGVEAGSILRRGADGLYHFVAALNFDLSGLQTITLAQHELYLTISEYGAAQVNQAKLETIVFDDTRMNAFRKYGRVHEIGSSLSLPVMIDAQVAAVLNLNAFRTYAFSPEAQEMAKVFAAQIGVLLQRLTLEHELERSNIELSKLANYDALTSLPNRALFADRLAQAIHKSSRQDTFTALIFLDLDGFKLINDSLGHSVGDELLKAVAARLSACVRDDDTVARLGGDEFTIILSSLKAPHDTVYVAEKVLHTLSKPFILDGRELHIGASIGITVYPDDGGSAEELVRHADTAMYHAKALGKNRYHFFTSELNARALEQLRLENDMRRGLPSGEFTLVYQPRVQLKTNEVTSLEALARWHHPELGLIAPNVFIPIAEKSNFIQLLGREVLRQACQQAKRWQEAGHFLRVAVNVSVKQLQQGTLVDDVVKALSETGLAANWLELEITESAAMTDVERNIGILRELRDMGVYISVDDFGTAYSSLNYLKRLPVNSLKIDKSFVEDISDTESADTAIVQAVIALGKSLGFSLIAEGVEDKQQLSFLRGAGCDEAQGYWFAKPLSAQDTAAWFAHHIKK
jgi:diguanylate cyclase (GGDEF)-like protein/PAS domain S-box-containing protein